MPPKPERSNDQFNGSCQHKARFEETSPGALRPRQLIEEANVEIRVEICSCQVEMADSPGSVSNRPIAAID
jgi:hypothetical protein